jgi:ATP-dependent helicase/nuclease subunit B
LFRLPTDVTEHLRDHGTLVVPSPQRAHTVRLAHAAAALEAGKRVWASADVQPSAVWLRQEAQRCAAAQLSDWPRLLTRAEEWYLWRQSAAQATHRFALLNGGALAESLQHSSELAAHYAIALKAGPPDSEATLLCEAQQVFDERCRSLRAASVGSLLDRMRSGGADSGRALLLRGFDTPSPRLQAIAAARQRRDAPEGREARGGPAEAKVLRAADAQEELERIAEWCRRRVLAQPDARLLVMLPGAPGARERLAALIRQALDPRSLLSAPALADSRVGIEGGQPLAQLPMIAHALTTLEWLAGAEGDFESFSRWLRAPHWSAPSAAARARLDLKLRERALPSLRLRELLGGLQLAPPQLQAAAREFTAQLADAAAALGEGSTSPRAWSERFTAALAAAGWPGPRAAESAGQQTLMRWHELLEEFGDLSGSIGAVARGEALSLVKELATRSAFRPADADLTVTLSPALADPVVRYDGIWVAGLHAEAFPQPVEPDPFLPLPAQVAAGIPAASAAGRLAQARTLLAAWGRGADELVLSTPLYSQDLELLPSPLLAGAAAEAPAQRWLWLPASLHREGLTETLIDATGRPWVAAQPLPRGTKSLDLQNQCPFRAYAELRLGSTRRESIEPGIAPNRRGELLHAALQKLWEQVRDSQALAALSDTALEALIARCVEQAAQATLARPAGRRRRHRAFADTQLDMFVEMAPALARECRRAARLIRRLCECERERAPFSVQALESDAELRLAGATLRMRIDRVDALGGGGRAILDYKSGRRVSADWYGERPTHPQLLAYSEALGEAVVALATVSVNAREVRFDGIARAPRLLPSVRAVRTAGAADAWSQQQRAWRALLTRLIRSFLAGDAAVDPRPGACDYCHVIDICRITERAGGADLPGPEAAHE